MKHKNNASILVVDFEIIQLSSGHTQSGIRKAMYGPIGSAAIDLKELYFLTDLK